jgi:hypothetical protein
MPEGDLPEFVQNLGMNLGKTTWICLRPSLNALEKHTDTLWLFYHSIAMESHHLMGKSSKIIYNRAVASTAMLNKQMVFHV